MEHRISCVLVLFSLLPISFRSNAQSSIRPMESRTLSATLPRSVLRIPISIRVSRLENSINQSLEGLLYEDKDIRDSDRMVARVYKASRIQLRMQGNYVYVTVPLSVWMKYDAGITELEGKGKIEVDLRTQYSIKSDWSLATQTELTNHRWLEKPVVQMMGVSMPIGPLADLVIQNTRKRISKEIDEAVAEQFALQDVVQDTWKGLFAPSLASPEYNAWLAVNPTNIGMCPIEVVADTCSTTLIVEAKPAVLIGDKPAGAKAIPLPPYTLYSSQRPGFEIHLAAEIPFSQARLLAKTAVEGETYTAGKRTVTVQDIELYAEDEQLVVEVRTTGSYNGSIYLKGTPQYNREKNAVEIPDLDFTLETRNFLLKGGAWLLKSTLKKKMLESMDFYLQYNLEETRKALETQLNTFPLEQGFRIQATVQSLEISQATLSETGFQVFITLSGQAGIRNY